ncbi:hypothetical protein [Azospirillum sp.]|uniref:hypothetical protein n=1 Tax=Azospirillum sp. TaxID=34012 RepID=UPI002D6C9CFC|nr:hypothetical protein [Azospirillum sp.]HYD66153.1 hypothetical protein [Azospirillum sp.]
MSEQKMRFNGWLALIIVSLILLAMALLIHVKPARAYDHHRPELDGWFKGLTSRAGAACCDGTDATPLDDVELGKPRRPLPRAYQRRMDRRAGKRGDRTDAGLHGADDPLMPGR